jgi:aerobic C4-dicarboxylate transport protein
MHIIPDTSTSAFASGNVLQILLISLLFGVALAATGERGRSLIKTIDDFGKTFFGIVHIIMKNAAIGVFGSIAFTVGSYGIGAGLPLLKLIGTFARCLRAGRTRRDLAAAGLQHPALHVLYP